jgi:hypothetical protein
MDWKHGSSGRAPALQMQSPEFKLLSHLPHLKKKERKDIVWIMNNGSERVY